MKKLMLSFTILSFSACASMQVEPVSEDKVKSESKIEVTLPTQKAKVPTICEGEKFRQFDFWVGDWIVTTPDGKYAGNNSIKLILNGCALHENWTGATGFRGESFSFYDSKKDQWHQTWIDYTGNALYTDGELVDGSMVLLGQGKDGQGNAFINRITWMPKTDGSVRQHWEASQDDGKTWSSVFDGIYKKANQE